MVRAALDINHSRRRKALYKVPSADLNPGYHRLGARNEVSGVVVPRRLEPPGPLCVCCADADRRRKLLMHSSPKTLVIFVSLRHTLSLFLCVCAGGARVTCVGVRLC